MALTYSAVMSAAESPLAVLALATIGFLCWSLAAEADETSEPSIPAGSPSELVLPAYDPWISDPEWFELHSEVVTPHTPWAKPYAGRRLKLVVIAPQWTQRATLELQQRFDMDASAVMNVFSHTWGDKNTPHYAWLEHGTEDLVTERAMAALGARPQPDVIVIGWMSCPAIPEQVEQTILDAVAGGAGLVIFNPRKLSTRLDALIERCRTPAENAVHPVVDGIPTQHLPPLEQQDPRDLIGQGITFYENDEGGRIVVVDYAPLSTDPYHHVNCYLSPPGADKDTRVRDIHYDYYCSLAGRCVLWATREMPQIRLTGWENLSRQISTQTGPANLGTLRVTPVDHTLKNVVAQYTIRDAEGTVEHRASVEIAPDGRIPLVVPQLTSGGHYADIILRDAQNRTLDWGSRDFTCTTGADITSISTDEESYAPNQPVPIGIALAGDLDGAELTVEIHDTYGRVVWTSVVPAQPRLSLQADLADARTVQCEILATLTRGSKVLAKRASTIRVRQPAPEADQYIYAAWASANPGFIRRQVADIIAAQGITTGILSGDPDEWARLNARPTPYMTRYYPDNPDEKGLCVRQPCLTDPKFLAEETAKLRENTERYRHYSPLAYSLGDDQGMMLSHQDGCISPTCLRSFREYLLQQYADIEALNASWKTAYTSFDQAMPLSLEEAVAREQFPAWADHRAYMDQLFVEMHRKARLIIQDVDPDARVGFEGPINDDSWYGYAWKELMDVVDLMVPYPNAWKFDIVRSFARSDLLFGGWYGGYAMYRNPDDSRFYPWFLLFSGCNSYWFFADYGWSGGGHPAQGLAPDLRILPCLRETTAQVRRIQEGIDRLVLGAERQTDGVAVYHSRASVHAATVVPSIPTRDFNTDPAWSHYIAVPHMKWALNTEANLRLLDDIGLSYTLVDRSDIAAGALKKGAFRLLVMPFVQAISPDEARAIKDFVKEGGAVLADMRPGLFDQHVKLLDEGQLDDLFGVRRGGSAMEPLREEAVQWTVGKADQDPMPVDPTVHLHRGTAALVTATDVPVFIHHSYGRGQACLMNMSIQHYLTLRAAGRGDGLQDLLDGWLAQAGIAPDVQVQAVGDHKARVRVFAYRDGETRLVGLLRPHKRLLDESDAFVDRSPRPFVLHVPEPGHIYDVINRTYYGQEDRLELQVPVATPFLLAILPYQVTKVAADISQTGRTVDISATVQVSDGAPGRHVIRMRVTDASGRRRPEYDASIAAPNGHGSETFVLALNDPTGEWTIEVEDVATGLTSCRRVHLGLRIE